MTKTSEVFLDTAFAIALVVPRDAPHSVAVGVANQLKVERTRMVTTWAVILEIGNALSRARYRSVAVSLLDSITENRDLEIVPFSERLVEDSFALFRARDDKEWSLTDCMSFVVMEDLGLTDALTTDRHFEQAGYRALLRVP
jgi:predicted nucleic acid-binding protein